MDLSALTSPIELHTLGLAELESLAHELRSRIISVSLKNGGHLGASLGAVELAIALHRVFESPRDRIVWDVGHQAYAHKLLTGRASRFETIRQSGGLSGFLSRAESEHDVFGAGHSSTSISAALGLSYGSADWTIAVIGDGALTAGVSFEALLQATSLPKRGPLLVVLNDNQMSISENVGVLPEILRGPDCGEFFSHFGFDYAGPIDGHDLSTLLSVLNGIRLSPAERPILMHVQTQKGRGYLPAESRPEIYHGVSPATADKTEPATAPSPARGARGWSALVADALAECAEADERIVAVTAAMSEGTGLARFFEAYPERAIDVGIAEPHAVVFSAGLAAGGKLPVVAIYSTFLQRAIDSMIHDVALQELSVLFAVDRAGLVGADGPTHHGTFDLVYGSMIPKMQIYVPQSEEDVAPLFRHALAQPGIKMIRYPRGNAPRRGMPLTPDDVALGYLVHGAKIDQADTIVVTIGPIGERIRAELAMATATVSTVCLVQLLRAHPCPFDFSPAKSDAMFFFYEEGVQRGSLSEGIAATLSQRKTFRCIPDSFVPHGSPSELDLPLRWDAASIREDLYGTSR